MRLEEYDEILGTVTAALRDYQTMTIGTISAHEQLRRQINVIHADLNMRGIRSQAIENATYSIETLAAAFMRDNIPEARDRYGFTLQEGVIFDLLLARKGKCVSRAGILDVIYAGKPDREPCSKVTDVHIHSMRQKLHNSGLCIHTDWGIGYRLSDGNPPPRKVSAGNVDWEGISLGVRMVAAATMLKASLGRPVTYEAFKAAGFCTDSLRSCIAKLKPRLREKYTIVAVIGQGYMMNFAIPQPVAEALQDLVA